MKFLIKSFVYIAIVSVGGYFAVNNIPSLKANILEVVNPQVKENRLVKELGANIEELNTTLSESTGPTTATVVAKSKQLVQDSQKLISQINDLNDAHPGVVSAVVSRVTGLVVGNGVSSTPTSTPSVSATGSSGSPVNPSTSPLSPCLPQ